MSAAVAGAIEGASETLVGAAARAALERLPTCFDGLFSWVMLECRLDADPTVDVVLHVDRWARASLVASCPAGWPHVARAVEGWTDARSPLHDVETLTFELDQRGDGWSDPVVFAAFEHYTGRDPGPIAARMAAAILEAGGPSAPPAWDHVLGALPSAAWPMHAAALTPRGIDGARLVASVPVEQLGRYLERLRWPGDPIAAQAIAARAGRFVSRMNVHVDVGEAVGPQIGLEVFHPGPPGRDARWTPAFALLSELERAKVDALSDWPRREGPAIRLLGLKFVIEGTTIRTAKAYLAFRERPPGA